MTSSVRPAPNTGVIRDRAFSFTHATDGAAAQSTSFLVASAEGGASQGGALPSSLALRLASLDIPVNSGFMAEDIDPSAFARLGASLGRPLLTRLHQLDAIFTIFGASDRDKRLILQGRGLRKRL
jgi:hypothetical protein